MKLSINKNELLEAISVVSKALSKSNINPVLGGILIDALDDSINLRTSNSIFSIQYNIPALVEEKGSCIISGNLLGRIINSLPDCSIQIVLQDSEVNILCENSSFSLKSLPIDDFPDFPQVSVDKKINIPYKDFITMINRVSKSASRDEGRAILTGILITYEDQKLKFVATDSYRLAVTSMPYTSKEKDFYAVIPEYYLVSLCSLPKDDEDITLSISTNQVVAEYKNITFINRRIEGSFPPYNQIIPKEYNTRVEINKNKFLSALKRVHIIGINSSSVKLIIDPEAGLLQITATTQDVGSAIEQVTCSGEGKAVEIGLNCDYLIDGVTASSEENIILEVIESNKPCILKAPDNIDYSYLIMPVRLG